MIAPSSKKRQIPIDLSYEQDEVYLRGGAMKPYNPAKRFEKTHLAFASVCGFIVGVLSTVGILFK